MARIDALDAKIVTLLQRDGRRPNVDIARQLKVAEGTVRKRIARLIHDEVIQIGAWTDPLKVGYVNYAIIMIRVNLPKVERVADSLGGMPEIFFVGTCTGAFDIFAAACFRSIDHLHEFMTRRLARLSGIQRVSTSSVTRVVKRDYSFQVVAFDGMSRDTEASRPVRRAVRVGRRRAKGDE